MGLVVLRSLNRVFQQIRVSLLMEGLYLVRPLQKQNGALLSSLVQWEVTEGIV